MPGPNLQTDSLDTLLAAAEEKYAVHFETISVGKDELQLLQISDMETYIEELAEQTPQNNGLELPFWAKIWPSSILLSHYIQRMDGSKRQKMLEIGAGIGICGLFAAKHGFDVTISDINEDALLFAKINILKNDLEGQARVRYVDFTQPPVEKYTYVLGSEVLYREETYRPLVKFLLQAVDPVPGSEVILAKSYKFKAKKFFNLAEKEFAMKSMTLGFKEQGETEAGEKHLCQIIRLRPKKVCSC